jgi:hypothetical protein
MPPHYYRDLAHGPGVGLGLLPRLPQPTCSRPVSGVGLGPFCYAASLLQSPGPCSSPVFRSAICDCLSLNVPFFFTFIYFRAPAVGAGRTVPSSGRRACCPAAVFVGPLVGLRASSFQPVTPPSPASPPGSLPSPMHLCGFSMNTSSPCILASLPCAHTVTNEHIQVYLSVFRSFYSSVHSIRLL